MLFKSVRSTHSAFTHFHIYDDVYRVNDWCDCNENAHPATKEQRDLLFQKMKESGYEWDAEKKELKKIEQQSAEWSEEDKAFLTVAIAVCNKYSHKDIAGWLKSLKPQPHWKPSEEQMKALYSALNDAISLYSDKVSPLYEKISRTHFNVLESLYNDLKKL